MIGVVVVAGHDSDRFRQRTQPGHQLHGIVVPQLVPGAFVQGRKTESGVRRTHRLAEPLQPLVRPHDVAHTVEREVPESLLEEILRPHLSGQEMRSGNVGYVREARLEILRDGDDAPLREQLHIVRIVKLSDHGVGAHPAGQLEHGADAELVADRQRQPAEAPRLPGIAGIYRPLIVGHMTRTLGMLLKNGVTLLKALHIVKSVADNKLMAQAVQNMIDGVQAGRDLSEFMNDPLVFPPLSRQMVAAGERSGQLGEMLLWVANDSENRVASRLQVVTSLMEPVMILLLGGIVGFVVIAIILPIFEMSTLAG